MKKKREILEYELKKKMFSKSINIIKPYICSKHSSLDKNNKLKDLYGQLINYINLFEKDNKIEYPLAFFFCLLVGDQYSKILQNENLLKSTLKEMVNEKNWDTGNVSFEVSIYFSYTFFNEIYKDIAIDSHLINNSTDPLTTLKTIIEEFTK